MTMIRFLTASPSNCAFIGDEMEIPENEAAALVAKGHAEIVAAPPESEQPQPNEAEVEAVDVPEENEPEESEPEENEPEAVPDSQTYGEEPVVDQPTEDAVETLVDEDEEQTTGRSGSKGGRRRSK